MYKKRFFADLVFSIVLLCNFASCVINYTSDGNPQENEHNNSSENKSDVSYKEITFSNTANAQRIEVEKGSSVYFVKYNESYYDVAASQTGYVSSVRSSRNVLDEVNLDDNVKKELKNRYTAEARVAALRNSIIEDNFNGDETRSIDSRIDCEVRNEECHIGDTRDFYLISDNQNHFTKYTGVCKAIGEKCYVWFINNNPDEVDESNFNDDDENNKCSFQTMADKFDSICELEESVLGSHIFNSKYSSDVINPTERISIVLGDIENNALVEEGSRIYGYFYSGDLKLNDFYSNNGEIIYLDSYIYQTKAKTIYSTIVHEYNHLLNCVQKEIINGVRCETWLTEMLAMVCEDMFQQYLGLEDIDVSKARLFYFNYYYYYGFMSWSNNTEELVSYYYPNAYAFGAYLARNFGGKELISKIARNRYGNEMAISDALRELGKTKLNSTEIANFKYVYENEFKILFNCYPDRDYTGYYSLNNASGNADDILYFSPIVLYEYSIGENEQGKPVFSIPIIFREGEDSCKSIGAYGFSVHFIGNKVDSFVASSPKSNHIKWLLIEL